MNAISREIDLVRRELDDVGFNGTFDTIFIGGGTPTCLSGKDLANIIHRLKKAFPLAGRAEITCEANPGSSNTDKFNTLRESGVNRLSIGAQSMNDDLLHAIGRTHTSEEIVSSMMAARDAGFDNVNLDLIFALPEQTIADWQHTLDRIIALRPDHLSCYSLIIEEGTPFGDRDKQGLLTLPGEDDEADMYEYAIEMLKNSGYDHYEISNFALPGKRSVHNQIYWRGGQYIGLGPGAHGFWNNERLINVRLPADYANLLSEGESPVTTRLQIDRKEQMDDVMIFGLRMLEGVSKHVFKQRFGIDLTEEYDGEIDELIRLGLIETLGDWVRLTAKGLPIANEVFSRFLRDPTPQHRPNNDTLHQELPREAGTEG